MEWRSDTGFVELLSFTALAVFGVGLAAGVLSGMFGVGGAVLTTPGIRALGASPIHAVGSTVPAILPGAITGTMRYARAGLVNWKIGLVCGLSGALLAAAGTAVAELVNAHYLMVLTAVLLGLSGVSVYRSGHRSGRGTLPEPEPAPVMPPESGLESSDASAVADPMVATLAAPPRPEAIGRTFVPIPRLLVVGAAAGFLAGLLGVGGGVVMMPAFTNVLRIPIKEAVASSLVAVAIFSTVALVGHARLGNIDWTYASALTVGTIPGAQLGSKLTLGVSEGTVRTLFGVFLVVLALIYGISELVAL